MFSLTTDQVSELQRICASHRHQYSNNAGQHHHHQRDRIDPNELQDLVNAITSNPQLVVTSDAEFIGESSVRSPTPGAAMTSPNGASSSSFTPGYFRGDHTDQPRFISWVAMLEMYFYLCDVEPKHQVQVALLYLRGVALQWFCHLVAQIKGAGGGAPKTPQPVGDADADYDRGYSLPFETWSDMKDAMTIRFSKLYDEMQALLEIQQVKQGSRSVQAYAQAFSELLYRLPPQKEERAIVWFVDGLDDDLQDLVMISKPATLSSTMAVAGVLEQTGFVNSNGGGGGGRGSNTGSVRSVRSSKSPTPRASRPSLSGAFGMPVGPRSGNNTPRHPSFGGGGSIPAGVAAGGGNGDGGNASGATGSNHAGMIHGRPKRLPLTQEERDYLREHNGCFRCRLLGHIATECPERQGAIGGTSNGTTLPFGATTPAPAADSAPKGSGSSPSQKQQGDGAKVSRPEIGRRKSVRTSRKSVSVTNSDKSPGTSN
ncbi:hypothetical protein EV182_004186 [Spiromyces aspiralis]|uniref:Uncharacterized protein n=1 Tax=Spiromyces aspiralis TaxID=68401 RepID=A0ACC1HF40_9FUNG|nr:hypothetical protein EV182_004186 [Spiromyces aspiralis]